MRIKIEGDAAPGGWPAADCRCASCSSLRRAGIVHLPTRVFVDDVPLESCSRWDVPGGFDARTSSGARVLFAAGPGLCPEPVADTVYDAVFLDLIRDPSQLALLRRSGAVDTHTEVYAVHVDHRISSPEELSRRLSYWRQPMRGPHRTLLLGGSRSGKSAEAEMRLISHPDVTYLATGPLPSSSDTEWAARVLSHQVRRPSWWRTLETNDIAAALRDTQGALLIDGLGTWLADVMDRCRAFEEPEAVRPWFTELHRAWRETSATVVAVTDEVGLSLVPTTSSGRLFRDLLGELNQLLAAESEDAALVVAGRIMG